MNAIDKFGAYRKAVELFDRVVEDLAPLRARTFRWVA